MAATQLTPNNAIVKTATVQINAITIDGRQVTQALFRQLLEEPLIGQDGILAGTPWGFVNHHPDGCGTKTPKHRHVVWQRGDELLRARVYVEPDFDKVNRTISNGRRSEQATATVLTGRPADLLLSAMIARWLHSPDAVDRVWTHVTWEKTSGIRVKAAASELAIAADEAYDELRQGRTAARERNLAKSLSALDAELEMAGTIKYLQAGVDAMVADELARRERWRTALKGLWELDQLFIAA